MEPQRQLEHMFAAAAASVLLPVAVVATSMIVGVMNTDAGYMRYRLPEWLLTLYSAGLVLGPAIGVIVLVTLWVRRAVLVYVAAGVEAGTRNRVVVAAMLAILLDAVWLALFPAVYFAAGGSR